MHWKSMFLSVGLAIAMVGLFTVPGAAAAHEETRDCQGDGCEVYEAVTRAPHAVPDVPDVEPCSDGVGAEGVCIVPPEGHDCPDGTIGGGVEGAWVCVPLPGFCTEPTPFSPPVCV